MSPAAPCPDLPAWRWGPPLGEGRAVVLLLHGLGHDAETVWHMLGPGLPADVSVLAPEGQFLGRDGAGHAWFSVTLGSQGPQANLAEEAQSRGRIIALAQALAAGPSPGPPLVLAGFSQGGILALNAMLERPDLFAGCAVATGRLMAEAADQNPPKSAHVGKPIFWGHGKVDPIIASTAVETGIARLAAYGMEISTMLHDGGHEAPVALQQALRTWLDHICPSS